MIICRGGSDPERSRISNQFWGAGLIYDFSAASIQGKDITTVGDSHVPFSCQQPVTDSKTHEMRQLTDLHNSARAAALAATMECQVYKKLARLGNYDP